MNYNGRTEISKEEYLQLLGLKLLATKYDNLLSEIYRGVLSILQEAEDGRLLTSPGDGWSGELVYTERTLDELLKVCHIEVTDETN